MLCYLYGDELANQPKLHDSMFRDRAIQFKDRLKWEVCVNENGHERDQYDNLNPLYVVWRRGDGSHGGSMRVLPTTGPCMVNDYFSDIAGGAIQSPLIWESTRFCINMDAGQQAARISAALMLAGCEIGLRFSLQHAVGVFDPRMVRIYRALGWSPEILGKSGASAAQIQVGLWEFSDQIKFNLCKKAGVSAQLSELWINRAFDNAYQQRQIA